ncbi:MAG: NAD-dependent epimerase/dehydratase family protein [Bacteroidia bacterium]|nr:NAD-dependent epimerase/dehydratase family protein [Bacteroidia bacterium]
MILVTGGTGLVGAHLIFDLIRSGRKVRALRRDTSSMAVINRVFHHDPALLEKVEWAVGDVTDLYSILEALEGVTEVYHCAAVISFNPREFSEMMRINVQGTSNMVNLSLEKGIAKFCHLSSVAALGRVEEGKIITEETVWKTSKSNSNYAISKYSAEREVWRGAEEGLSVVVVNPSVILGAGDWNQGSSKLFRQVWNGLRFYTGGMTGFVDVRDVSSCCTSLMDKNIFNKRFILNSENISYQSLLSFIAEGFHKRAPQILAKPFLAELAWRVEGIRSWFLKSSPLITKETSRNGSKKWTYSNERIRKELDFNFIPVKKSAEDACLVYLQEMKQDQSQPEKVEQV